MRLLLFRFRKNFHLFKVLCHFLTAACCPRNRFYTHTCHPLKTATAFCTASQKIKVIVQKKFKALKRQCSKHTFTPFSILLRLLAYFWTWLKHNPNLTLTYLKYHTMLAMLAVWKSDISRVAVFHGHFHLCYTFAYFVSFQPTVAYFSQF